MNLQDFLNNNLVNNLTEEVVISPRFVDDKGIVMKFKIKAMTNTDFDELRKVSMEIKKNRKVEFDSRKFNLNMIINHTITPDFKQAESLKKLGVRTPEEYVESVLLAGEVTTLAEKIQDLSGFNKEMGTLVEEAKN
ncbi:XkdN-like protein [Paenibacillus pinisoli]|uniref:XkdN-like protein n=1 Tax=Paenibacillus pinisoli TaxID=1276110 RepID=A0A3A6PL65_9BACL|nr:XkdN-like protein [Paenibacillus pinisoli]RJX40058.1 XkdN-like protein [Paenibacillus pinisoli]